MGTEAPRPHTGGGNNTGTRRAFGNIRKLPSKRFQASYLAPDGKRVNGPTTFETKTDARKWLAMEQAAITERRWRPAAPKNQPVPFETFADGWLRRRELRPRTRIEYAGLLAVIYDTFATTALTAITPVMVRNWYADLGPDRPTQRAHCYALLRTVLASAVEDGLIDANPCTIRGAGRSKRVRQIRPATLAELTTIVDAMPARLQLMVQLAAWCALRFGELTELRRSDVEIRKTKEATTAVLKIRRGVTWVGGKPVVGPPKTDAGARDVSVPPHLVAELAAHLLTHTQEGPDGLLFPASGGDAHLSHGSFYKRFGAARKAAGRDDLRLHDLRHTGAVMAAHAGATTRELMDRLGHTTPTMSMRYQHVADGRQDEIARRLSAMVEAR